MYSHQDHTDSEALWKQFLQGDADAHDALVKKHYNLLYQYGCRFTIDTGLVKDCIQDLFLYLWRKKDALSETPSVRNYLIKAMRRRLQRALSKTNASMPGSGFIEFMSAHEPATENNIIAREQSAELANAVRKALASLSKRQQEIIHLRFYLDADAAQIADIMELGRQSVYNLLHDAIRQLRTVGESYFKTVLPVSTLLLLLAALPGLF